MDAGGVALTASPIIRSASDRGGDRMLSSLFCLLELRDEENNPMPERWSGLEFIQSGYHTRIYIYFK